MTLSDKAKQKFQGILDKGKTDAVNLLTNLQNNVPTDALVKTAAMNFVPRNAYQVGISFTNSPTQNLHPHALSQAVKKSEVLGATTARKLLDRGEPWATELLAKNLNTIFSNLPPRRFLIRSVENEVRGILSDRFKLLNSGPIVESFVGAARSVDAVPTQAKYMDTKVSLTMCLPQIFEPIPNEVMTFGATLSNSDFGNGAVSLKFSMLRIWCTNLAIMSDAFRKIHLGARLPDEVTFSEETYKLDTEVVCSAISDMVKAFMSPEKITGAIQTIKASAEEHINVKMLFEHLKKGNLITGGEEKEIAELYNTPDIELLPAGNNRWRASNAISLFAQRVDSPERALQLQELAGEVIERGADDKRKQSTN